MARIGMLGLGEAGGAIAGADLVLSLTTAAAALTAAGAAAPALRPGQVYGDADTAGAALKRELAAVIEPTGAAFADVALMAPVPGTAAMRKLLRSVAWKGVAAAVCEALAAARVLLRELGVAPHVCDAARAQLEGLQRLA